MTKNKIFPARPLEGVSPERHMHGRRNALTGFSDNRYPEKAIPAQFGLYSTMTPLIHVAAELDEFLRKVYCRENIMKLIKDPEVIFDEIYQMYTETGDGYINFNGSEVIQQAYGLWKKIIRDISEPFVSRAYYQLENVRVKEINPAVFSKKPYRSLALNLAQDFVMFPFNNMVRSQCRVYLNIACESRVDLVYVLSDRDFKHRNSISSVKIIGPCSNRADTAVIYCGTEKVAKETADVMKLFVNDGSFVSTNQTVPAMTTRIGPGVAISIGAEPRTQGPVFIPSMTQSKILSFGAIRSQAIAMAILYFRKNISVMGSEYEVFKQIAAIGFKEFGLDPASPAN